jgi:heptosyltransferase-2
VLASGGARNLLRNDGLRRWPLSHYARLGKLITGQGWELILTGSEGDAWVKEAFTGIPFTDMIGKQNLCEFIDFLSGTDLLVTHDSGPLHLADLAQCPVIGLFGPTMPEEKKSLQEKSIYLWGGSDLSCRPCYDGRNYGNCSSNECLISVSPELVWEKVSEQMAG